MGVLRQASRGSVVCTLAVMKSEMPIDLQRLIQDELYSDSGLGGRRFWWQRPAVLAMDIADDVAAALLWRRGGIIASAMFERCGGQWRLVGGGAEEGCRRSEIFSGRPRAETAGPAHILTVRGSTFMRRKRAGQGSPGTANAGWVANHHLRLASEVGYLDTDGRRIEVPAHGHVVVVWASPQTPAFLASRRPRIVACRRDGTVLSELGPNEFVDSATLSARPVISSP
jgi:hypothetical protein